MDTTTDADSAACAASTLRFFRALDARDHAACAAAFAPGGAWHRQGRRLDTTAAIMASLEKRPADRTTTHLITNVIADRVDADRIVLRFLLTAYEGPVGVEGAAPVGKLAGILDCRDEYVRTAAGWCIADKSTRPLFKGA